MAPGPGTNPYNPFRLLQLHRLIPQRDTPKSDCFVYPIKQLTLDISHKKEFVKFR